MARFKARFKKKLLRAKYVCPQCKRVGYYRCWLEAGRSIYGRPREDYCRKGHPDVLTEYRGFVSTYVETVPHAVGGRMELPCRGCGKDTEHASIAHEGRFWRCLRCGLQRLADDAGEAARLEAPAPGLTSDELYGKD